MKHIKRFFNLFRKKEAKKIYPVADPKNVKYIQKETPIEQILLLWAVLLFAVAYSSSCSPTASLPNGCKYKLIAPKFTK